MYQPAHFVESRPEVLQQLIREHPFALLVTDGASGLAADGVPFLLDPDPAGGPGVLRAHVARANPVWREARADVESLVVFQGAQGYVSPAWYPSKAEHGKVVPTWNYVIVQGRGTVRFVDDAEWLRAFVSRLTDRHEGERAAHDGAAAWAVTDAPPDYVDTMLRAIVGVEIVTRPHVPPDSTHAWVLSAEDGTRLVIPIGAEGADRLLDALSPLPGIDFDAGVAAVAARGPGRATMWRKAG